MSNTEIKNDIHKLKDALDNGQILEHVYTFIERTTQNRIGNLQSRLSSDEQEELLVTEKEITLYSNVISREEVKQKLENWLK